MNIEWILPETVVNIYNIFKLQNYQLYIVGGAVRDKILNLIPKDYDLCTNALPEKIKELLEPTYIIFENGASLRNGVVNICAMGIIYEITTFRIDEYKQNNFSVRFSSINEDVKRRDLTINAIYYDIENKCIIDLVDGINDIKNKFINTVGKAIDRFNEDRLRILRAIRFASRFDCIISDDIDTEILSYNDLSLISKERIRNEFYSSITTANSISKLLNLYKKYDLFSQIFDNLNINFDFDFSLFDNLNIKDHIIILTTLLVYNDIDILKKKLLDLKYNKKEISIILFLIKFKKLNLTNSYILKKESNEIKIKDELVKNFSLIFNLDLKLIEIFLKYKITTNGNQLLDEGYKGEDIKRELNDREIKLFAGMF